MCCALPMTASATASMDEQLTSGASSRIIPVFKDLRRAATILSFSLRRFFLFLYSVLRCFLLILLPHHRRRLFFFFSSSGSQSQSLSEDSSSSSSASSSSSSRRRFAFRRFEEDTLRRRALAEGLGMLSEASVADSTSLFVGLRRNALFCRSWFPVPPTPTHTHIKGILVIIHGLNEHSGRYAHFARQLTSNKFGVYAMDWIGHGGSDGLHGYVPSLDHVVADTGAFLEKVKSENPGVPCFLFGHSTGGAVVLKAASDPQIKEMLEGIVLTSPALRVKPAHPIVRAVAPLFSLVIPTFQFKGANKRGIPVSRDPAALLAKYSDPLVYTGPIRVRTGHEILRISSYLMRNFRSVTIPFFVLHGTADKVTDPLASKDLYTEASSTIKDIRLYDGFLHDLLFEPEREAIAQDIIEWMDKRLSDAGQRA